MAEKEVDWLFPTAEKDKAAQEQQGLVFAQKYLVFYGPTADPRARELLEHWTNMARSAKIPVTAGVGEYAAANAFREFIEKIHAQIDFAMKGAQSLPPQTRKTNG